MDTELFFELAVLGAPSLARWAAIGGAAMHLRWSRGRLGLGGLCAWVCLV